MQEIRKIQSQTPLDIVLLRQIDACISLNGNNKFSICINPAGDENLAVSEIKENLHFHAIIRQSFLIRPNLIAPVEAQKPHHDH